MDKIVDTDAFQHIGAVAGGIVEGLKAEQKYQGKQIIRRGVYSGVPIDDYHGNVDLFDGFSISSSGLRAVLRRPSEYWGFSPYNKKPFDKPEKDSLEFGKAAHMLLLGEDGFKERYVLRPEKYPDDKGGMKPWSGQSNWCKGWLSDQKKAGRVVITETDITHIRHIATALGKKEAIRLGILNGRIERSIFCKDGDIWLKTRPDVVPNDSGDFVDLKTAASVDDESLSKAIYNHGYHVQAGLLRMIVRQVLGADAFTSFTFVFVEKAPPYDVRVMQLKDEDIDLGERQARVAIDVVNRCLKENIWPGYDGFGKDFGWVEMPSWSKTRIKNQLEAA
ncbi:PD-(D/E)XK nuclease-like domain-containing protein [Rhizobium lusitanum]|uniref:PD-(D/E)XK nuclease-like domain-containing protein n=1 Tax=Rhizobium lusitanum TaxID=293958 RepID=UPI00195E4612|nr:PD-(D/E)XK nuclease-like domain-containing protein [Rhizobium lusitanum]MBM7046095.1 PD-(D/E)XK nuclease-like domain-containing protein [Rhizobium lusitanum]